MIPNVKVIHTFVLTSTLQNSTTVMGSIVESKGEYFLLETVGGGSLRTTPPVSAKKLDYVWMSDNKEVCDAVMKAQANGEWKAGR